MPSEIAPIRALVVDDSALYRKIVSTVLMESPQVELVGTATNGQIALQKIKELRPDLLTVDFEMPMLDGIGLLQEIAKRKLGVTCIMVSSFTAEGAEATTKALKLGAFDFVIKPQTKSVDDSLEQLRRDLRPKLDACLAKLRRIDKPTKRAPPLSAEPIRESPVRMRVRPTPEVETIEVVGIGVSTGGPQALAEVLPRLPADFNCPILVVQHMPPLFTKSLADDLNRKSRLEVREAADGDVLKPGRAYIAPGGKQLKIVRLGPRAVLKTTNDPPEKNCKPAVNYTFRSIAKNFGPNALGVILTGMGDDGTEGARAMKLAGARIFAQDEASSTVYGMPRMVIETGLADQVLPLDKIAAEIASMTNPKVTI